MERQLLAADLRSYPADNEDLAEGQVGAAILLMKPVLEKEGVRLKSVVDDFGDEKYQIVMNGICARKASFCTAQENNRIGVAVFLFTPMARSEFCQPMSNVNCGPSKKKR